VNRRAQKNPHLKTLEQSLAARFGWQPGGALRDAIVDAVASKADRLGLDEVSYCRMASSSPGELHALAEEVAPGETRFFREPEQARALVERVLPEIASARAEARRLRLWSVAASSGEEAYTLAILAREALPVDEEWRVELIASDLRGHAILTASRGRYRASSLRAIDVTLRNRYFIGVDEPGPDREYELIPLVRRLVTFRRANLCEPHIWRQLPGPYDVIVCQNLLLYFHTRAVEAIAQRLRAAVAAGGYLVVSPSEIDLVPRSKFSVVDGLPAGFFRANDTHAEPPGEEETTR
jgi:chemotaxis protein methyltransferase CheR